MDRPGQAADKAGGDEQSQGAGNGGDPHHRYDDVPFQTLRRRGRGRDGVVNFGPRAIEARFVCVAFDVEPTQQPVLVLAIRPAGERLD